MTSETVLGIDFGTTNSVSAVLSGGDPEILENAEGDRITPSVAYYTQDKEQNRPLIGKSAQNKAKEYPERVIASIKRNMGDSEYIEVDGEDYRVEEVAADIIRKLRTDAANKLDVDREELTKAVVTTPAYWESDRNKAVKQAAELAGFTDQVETIKEPAAAAIAYGRFEPGLDKTVGVYDLGGGTFDFALVDVKVGRDDEAGEEYDVITQSGHPSLGGDDWDQRIVEWVASNFKKETGVDPLSPHHSYENEYSHKVREERIRAKAREVKEDLSNRSKTEVNIRLPFLMEIGGESMDLDMTLTETKFESLTDDLLEQTKDPIYTALNDAGKDERDIDEVILIGGSTRMPQVKELVKSVFHQEPKRRVNPDEAVAAGAAIKANQDNDILLLEVTPLSLGIGISGDRFKRMIHRNERVPATATEVFTTSNEGATAVRIPIYQGERDIASENRHLKTLIIQGMTPGSRTSAHIEVTFRVDKSGLIHVSAMESTRNKSVEVDIENENQLPDNYISDKLDEAREMEEMDRRRQKVIEAQNQAEKAITESERLLNEFPHVFENDEDEHVKKHITNVRQVRKDNTATLGELREATENLNEWVLEVGDRVRRTGARNTSGPKAGPDTDPAEVETDEEPESKPSNEPGEVVLGGDETGSSTTMGGIGGDSGESNDSVNPDENEDSFDVGGNDTAPDTDSDDSEETTNDRSEDTESTDAIEMGASDTGDDTAAEPDESESSPDVFMPDGTSPGGMDERRGEEPESSPGNRMEMDDSDDDGSGTELSPDWEEMSGADSDSPSDPAELGGEGNSSTDTADESPTSDSSSSEEDTGDSPGILGDDETVISGESDESDLAEKNDDSKLPAEMNESTDIQEAGVESGSHESDVPNDGDNSKPDSEKDPVTESEVADSEEDDASDESDDAEDDEVTGKKNADEISSGESAEQVGLDDIDM